MRDLKQPLLVIYGATGFSGRLVLERALARGLRPIVAGRDAAKLEALAGPLSLEWRAIALHQSELLRELAASATVVINAAGPFADTAQPLVSACLAGQAHYLDIAGEVRAVEAIAARHDEARAAGVMLLPAVGFDVVPTDCLAAYVAAQLPTATTLRIGVDVPTTLSRGSLQTGLAQAADGIWTRQAGSLVAIAPATATHRFDFGRGPELALGVSLCDVATAWRSTGIPAISTYLRASLPLWTTLNAMRAWGPALASAPWRDAVARQARWMPDGPSDTARRAGSATAVAEVTDDGGRRVAARLRTPEAYTVTAHAAVLAAERVLAGMSRAGYLTPAQLFGPDFVLEIEGVTREDL